MDLSRNQLLTGADRLLLLINSSVELAKNNLDDIHISQGVSLCQFFFLFSFFEAPSDAKRAHPSPHHARLSFSWLALFARRPYFLRACHKLRACLHGGGGPHVGEVTRLGGVTRLPI